MSNDMSMTAGGYEGYVIRDEDAPNPRKEFDNLGRMVCGHRRYNLGDSSTVLGYSFDVSDYDGWDDVEASLKRWHDAAVILPLYLYDHSGLTISTTPFSGRFDSGQVGFTYITNAALRENCPHLTESERMEAGRKALLAEVKTYDAYLRGDVHGWQIVDADGSHVDSCFGYYSREDAASDMKATLERMAAERRGPNERAHYMTEC